MKKLKRKEPEKDEILSWIDFLRNKQSNHLNAMVGTGVSFVFGLVSINELLLFIPFSIMILSIFLHFFSRYRHYLIAESVLSYQAGLQGHEPILKLLEEGLYPRRPFWWMDEEWFNTLMENTNKKHGRSLINLIWLLIPRCRRETFCLCVIWGSIVFFRLFNDSFKTVDFLNLYDRISSIVICFLNFMQFNQEYFFHFSRFLVLIAIVLSALIVIIRESKWLNDISDFKENYKNRRIIHNEEELTIKDYSEKVLYPRHMEITSENEKKTRIKTLTDLIKNIDLMKPLYLEAESVKLDKKVKRDITGIAEDTATSCWVALTLFKFKKEDEDGVKVSGSAENLVRTE